MFIFFFFVLTFFTYVYSIIKSAYFWERNGNCNPRLRLICTNAINNLFFRNHIVNRVEIIYRAYPMKKFIGYYEFFRPTLLIKDPNLIEDMFIINSDYFHDRFPESALRNRINQHIFSLSGKKWKQVRNKMILIFSPMKLKNMYFSLRRCSETLTSFVR